MIEIKILSKNDISQVFPLFLSIPDPLLEQHPEDKDQKVWEAHFDQNGVLYGGYVYSELAGFIFFYDITNEKKSAHCWQVGVIEKYRGKELLKFMMDEAVKELKNRGYQEITIDTYVDRYPLYHQYLLQNQFGSMYNDRTVDAMGAQTKVVAMKKQL